MGQLTFSPPLARPAPPVEAPAPLDVSSDETLFAWASCSDGRTLNEFAVDGGRPLGPANRSERELPPLFKKGSPIR